MSERKIIEQDCAMQHIICYQQQAMENKKADFGEPCKTCKHASECKFDWFQKISNALPDATLKIKLAHLEQQGKQDSDHNRLQQDMDTRQHNRKSSL